MNRAQTGRRVARAVLTATLGFAGLFGAGCAGQGDIDRTQPDKLDKSFFLLADGTPKSFYYRETYVGVPPTSGWTFEGTMSEMGKIRFQITETALKGYRAYDYAPGSQNDFTGGTNNTDTPVVIYPITSHFDVKREYNPGTGEQTNVISENTTDRPWYQRQYMRVDWTKNLVDGAPDAMMDPSAAMFATQRTNVSFVSEGSITDQNRPIMTPSYIDFVTKETRTPDYNACYQVFDPSFDDVGPWGCGAAELTVRHSLMEAKPSAYKPLEYPDHQPLLDDSGNPIRLLAGRFPCTESVIAGTAGQFTGADCTNASVDVFAKFGFFRTVRQLYDRQEGATDTGRKYYINRWNIWRDEIARDDQGNPVLTGLRNGTLDKQKLTREIAYYTNVEFPDDPALWDIAKKVTGQWNDALKMTAAGLILAAQGVGGGGAIPAASVKLAAGGLPDILVLKQNSCNLSGVQDYLAAHADVKKKVQDALANSVQDTKVDLDNVDNSTLIQTCTALEAVTEKLADGDKAKFTWQRNGDLRYSFFHWVDRPQPAGPLGYGPSSADPETGEIISAALYNYGAALDTYSQQSAESVELLNGTISVDDILSGKTIADIVRATAAARSDRDAETITPEARALAGAMLQRGASGPNAQDRLVPIPPGASDAKIEALQGTDLEKQLMTTDILAATVPGYNPNQTLDPGMAALASPSNWLTQKARDARKTRFQKLAMNGCTYMADFADDAILGRALDLAGLSKDEIFHKLRAAIFEGLSGHEMGHTMGLRHNFSGSTDALNYADQYWSIRSTEDQADWAKDRLREYTYSTVMDYGAKFNSDINGLGKYDYAAIRFGYGQLVDVMPPDAPSTGDNLRSQIFSNDYTKLPDEVGGVGNLQDYGVQSYGVLNETLRQAYMGLTDSGGGWTTAERPYKFCSDEFNGNLDCKTWDEGANQTEIVNNTIDRYKNYYFFNAFKRGRQSWTLDGYLDRLMQRYFVRYTEAFQFYYFYGYQLTGSDLADDLLKASIDSLNALGEILQTPEPGMHCATSTSPDLLVLPDPNGPNACVNGQAPTNIDFGDGKPYFIDFSDDPYYYQITRAGSLYDKLAALISLTSTEARFYRVDTFADSNNYSINYYRMFKDQMLNLIGGVIRNDPSSYGGWIDGGHYRPTPVVDMTMYGQLTPTPPGYMGTKRVDTPVNKTIRYYALLLSMAELDSTWDSTLDIADYMRVSLKGSSDDLTYASTTPIKEFTHPQTGETFRAPIFDASNPNSSIGGRLIDELNGIVGQKGTPGTLPTHYGVLYDGTPYPDWQTAKANLDKAWTGTDQNALTTAQTVFQNVDFLMAYRVDLLGDLRTFRSMLGR